MSPDDPRHGTRRGYYAHRRAGQTACDACKRGAAGAEARYEMNRAAGIPGRIDPTGTVRRLRALVALGYTWTSLDRYMGHRMAEKFGSGRMQYVFPATHQKVCETYEKLSMTLPPQTTPAERAAVTKAHNMARRNGWAPPLAWNDHDLDNPDAQPHGAGYQPATRAETLRDLADRGAGITEACRALKVSRDSLQTWAARHQMSDVYRQLAAREALWTNQHMEVSA